MRISPARAFPGMHSVSASPCLRPISDPNDPYLSIDKGPGIFDMHHRFSLGYVWELPFGRGHRFPYTVCVDKIVGGWELSGITTFEVGRSGRSELWGG